MLSIRSKGNQSVAEEVAKLQIKLLAAQKAIGADAGMSEQIKLALIQLHRFVISNIEVDTSRTKNSIFQRVTTTGNVVNGMLASNVSYSPYVRNAQHTEPFFRYAARVEGPKVLADLGREFSIALTEIWRE